MHYILIADDDPDLLELVRQMAEFSKMRTKCIVSGADFFPCLEAEDFDLVLMDIFMGTYDGREMSKQMKSDPRFTHIPLLLYSAGEIDAASIDQSGADGFLKKPFEMTELIGRLQQMLPS